MESSITNIEEDIKAIYSKLTQMSSNISNLSSTLTTLDNKFNDYVKKYPAIFDSRSYGTDANSIKNPLPGQIYFTINESD